MEMIMLCFLNLLCWKIIIIALITLAVFFVCFFFGSVWVVTLESLYTHVEASSLQVKSCKFWPILGTHGHWAVRVYGVQRLPRLWWSSLRTRDTHTCCQAWSGPVTTGINDLGLSHLGYDNLLLATRTL